MTVCKIQRQMFFHVMAALISEERFDIADIRKPTIPVDRFGQQQIAGKTNLRCCTGLNIV